MEGMPPLKQPKYMVVCADDNNDTYRYVGPFLNAALATGWARHNFPGQPSRWMAAPLEEPDMPPLEIVE